MEKKVKCLFHWPFLRESLLQGPAPRGPEEAKPNQTLQMRTTTTGCAATALGLASVQTVSSA